MKKLAQRIIQTGMDFSTRKALKNTLNFLGMQPENIDQLYIDLRNAMALEVIPRIPVEKRAVFLPQCLRNSQNCKATLTEDGWQCTGCTRDCKVNLIRKRALEKGYMVFVVPGGSMIVKLMEKYKPKAVIGIACKKEITMAMEEIHIPTYGVELSRDGCVNTDVDLQKVFEILDL